MIPFTASSSAGPTGVFPTCRTGDLQLDRALRCALGDVVGNLVPARLGLLETERPVLMAGLTYEAWTRDAAINAWNLLNAIDPLTARDTLRGEVVRADGAWRLRGQYWDAVVWVLGAWDHALWTGDRAFLAFARAVAADWLARMEREEFSAELGLFRGPACFNDGVSGYDDRYARAGGSSCILDWAAANPGERHAPGAGLPMHTLSTNCLYQRAYVVLGEMDRALGEVPDAHHAAMAERMAAAIRSRLWRPEDRTFRYAVDPWGTDERQEGLGHAFADLFGLAPEPTIARLAHTPAGLPSLWPTYARYEGLGGTRSSPGRHSGLIWPHVEGFAAEAAARAGRPDLAWATLRRFAMRALRDGQFSECYHPVDGLPDGGVQEIDPGDPADWHAWCLGPQTGSAQGIPVHAWLSQPRTTWGATALWRLALRVLAGLDPRSDGLHITPCLPPGSSALHITGLRFHQAIIDLHIEPGGGHRLTIDGHPGACVPAGATGRVTVIAHAG